MLSLRPLFFALFATSLCCISSAFAQSDAETALASARTAYEAEEYEKARDFAKSASQTDAKNPDIWLLLGKAHYQLGEVDAALAAWKETLKFAPEQAHAKRMVAALSGQAVDADARLKVIEALLDDQVFSAAGAEIGRLEKNNALTEPQQRKLLALSARYQLGINQPAEALGKLEELAIRFPQEKDLPATRLLLARTEVLLAGKLLSPGLARLKKLAEDEAETAIGKAAQLELLLFELQQNPADVEKLIAWMEANGEHAELTRARVVLVDVIGRLLAVSTQGPEIKEDAELSESDQTALAAAQSSFAALVREEDETPLVQVVLNHLRNHYVGKKAFAAATAGVEKLAAFDLLPASQRLVAAFDRQLKLEIASAELAEIPTKLADRTDASEELVAWIAAHEQHPQLKDARAALLDWHLSAANHRSLPEETAELAPADLSALEVAADIYAAAEKSAEALALTEKLIDHFKTHYTNHGAFAAALAAQEKLLELELPKTSRVRLLHEKTASLVSIALRYLKLAARDQKLAAGPLPESLAKVLASYKETNEETPHDPTWLFQANFAEHVNAISAQLPWPAEPESPKPTQSWAIEIALPVVNVDPHPGAAKARQIVEGIVTELAALPQQSAEGLAIAVQTQLLEKLKPASDPWAAAQIRRLELLGQLAENIYVRNVRSGDRAANDELSEPQQQAIAALKTLVESRSDYASFAVTRLEQLLATTLAGEHLAAVEAAYSSLKEGLPEQQQFTIDVAITRLWATQVITRDNRALARGFEVAAELDPLMKKALIASYELQRDIPENDPRLEEARQVQQLAAGHYRSLEMYEVVAEVLAVKAEEAVPSADRYAQLQLADQKLELAQREQSRLLETFGGREAVAFTPAFEAAAAAYEKYITDHPSHPAVSQVVEKLFAIAGSFETYEQGDVAAAVYRRIEAFAAKVEEFQQAAPGAATVSERAALAAANALHTEATRALAETLKSRTDDAAPPAAVSEQFTQAINAYQKMIADYPRGVHVKTAMQRIIGIGLEYANINSWDVADAIYGGLLEQELPLRRPEQIEFARAICQVGKVMPDHARQILQSLSQAHSERTHGPTMIAGLSFSERWKDLYEKLDDDRRGDLNGNLFAPNNQLAGNESGGRGQGQGEFPPQPTVPGEKPSGRPGSGTELAETPANPDPADLARNPLPADPFGDFGNGSGGFGPAYREEELREARRDAELLAAVQQQRGMQASQVAQLRDTALSFQFDQAPNQSFQLASAVLSEAEITRQEKVIDEAYKQLQSLRTRHPLTSAARQAREEILVLIGHWRSISQWKKATELAKRFLADNPKDRQLPTIRQEIARDLLALASSPVKKEGSKQALLEDVNSRFNTAREELAGIVNDFPENAALRQQAQWDIAASFLTQARVVASLSSTLARGQYVRSATELMRVAQEYHDHPRIGEIPQMLGSIASELAGRSFHEEAISVWNLLSINYPLDELGRQAALSIAQTHQSQNQPLRAVEAYVELNFGRGGDDAEMQNAIYNIAASLKQQKRWVEALHVLETFVDSFPQHAQAGEALTMIGQIHQTNEVWKDAIASYDRVIKEYPDCQWVKEARWSIAECRINLSQWKEAIDAYQKFAGMYNNDPQAATALERIEVLKDLDRYQKVVDEDQRKSFDAQYQIGAIVRSKLNNPVKSIIEYRKVAKNWPESHLADDALYQVGIAYLDLGNTEEAREALLAAAEKYPSSPLADDALFMVGRSYETEAEKFAAVTRSSSIAIANDLAQKEAYQRSQGNRRDNRFRNQERVTELKKEGKFEEADELVASNAANTKTFDYANAQVIASWASQEAHALTAAQLADRQDKINASLRKAVAVYGEAAKLASADKSDDALLRMAGIYDSQLKDDDAAMKTWLEIVKQFSGTEVAEDASWKIAKYYEQHSEFEKAIEAYTSFLRNYRTSGRAGEAQAAIAENYEQLGKWVNAMDAYTNYINNFPEGPLAARAREQINWIKTYRL